LACSSNLLFADDDSAILDDLTPLLEYLRSGEFQGVQPLILRLRNDNIIDSSGDFVKKRNLLYYPYSRGSGTKIQNLNSDLYLEEIPSMRSAFMMVRKDAFLAVGGFDETFNFNFEDVDIGWRLTCAGYGLLFIPTVKALHKGGRTTGERDEESYRLLLLNFHAVQLKFVGFPCWPWIFSRFLALMSVYEFAGIWRRNKGVTIATRNLAIMIALFLERFKQALYYRRLLSEVFHLKGRKKLEAMARGKRFIHSLT
jgi:GT2 family glycosyltransferase